MPAIFEYHHTVCDDEIDVLGHANNVCYVAWMQDAALAHSAAQGWPAEAYGRLGMGWVVRSHAIEYHQPCGPAIRLRSRRGSRRSNGSHRCAGTASSVGRMAAPLAVRPRPNGPSSTTPPANPTACPSKS